MHWDNIEEIVAALEETYFEEEIPERDMQYLHEMVLSLPDFEDHETEPKKEVLKQIVEQWIEIRSYNE